jgi:minor extracellular serine protease Vpr
MPTTPTNHPSHRLSRTNPLPAAAAFVRGRLARVATLVTSALAGVLLTGGSAAFGAPAIPPALRHLRPDTELSQRFLTRGSDGAPMVELIVQGDVPPGLLRARGIEVNTVAGRLMTARCPVGLLSALLQIPGIERVQVAERTQPNLDRSAIDVGARAIRSFGSGGIVGPTGSGVIVGLVDTGLDLSHLDFRRENGGGTRVLGVWDQTTSTGTPPIGFSYGAAFDSSAINAGLATEQDTEGHGTHVLGIAAGNGAATGNGLPAHTYVGIAPGADLVAVKTDFSTTGIVDGVSYVFQKAAALGKRAVVNLSLGTQDGPHDGTHDMDLMINALTGPGRIVVAAAGNDGAKDLHGRVTLAGTTTQTMTLNVPAYSPRTGSSNDYLLFSGWYPGGDAVSVTIVTPGGTAIGPVLAGTERIDVDTPDGYVNLYNGVTSPPNGAREVYIEIYDEHESTTPKSGTWQFQFTPTSLPTPGAVDLYLYSSHIGFGSLARWVQGLSFGGVINSPADADSVICVAAHTTKSSWDALDGGHYSYNPVPAIGAIAYFSSQGPRRDGVQKPDLSAPGYGVISSKSSLSGVGVTNTDPDGVHSLNGGTSMSSPHVAGAVALLLALPEWAGKAPSDIRARLRATARQDSATGTTPNVTWGYGKLNLVTLLAPAVTAVAVEAGAPLPRLALLPNRPNPFNPATTIAFTTPAAGSISLRVYGANGRLVRRVVEGWLPAGSHEARWDGRDQAGRPVASGIYLYELAEGAKRLTRKMSLLK